MYENLNERNSILILCRCVTLSLKLLYREYNTTAPQPKKSPASRVNFSPPQVNDPCAAAGLVIKGSDTAVDGCGKADRDPSPSLLISDILLVSGRPGAIDP